MRKCCTVKLEPVFDEVGKGQRGEPIGVVSDGGFLAVEYFEGLFSVGLGIGCNLFGRHTWAQLILVGWIAYQSSEGTYQKSDVVAEVLKLTQFAHGDGMAEVQIGCGGIVAAIDAQGAAFLFALVEALAQVGSHAFSDLRVAVVGALHEEAHLLVDGWLGHGVTVGG